MLFANSYRFSNSSHEDSGRNFKSKERKRKYPTSSNETLALYKNLRYSFVAFLDCLFYPVK